jgi:hypothetical protein
LNFLRAQVHFAEIYLAFVFRETGFHPHPKEPPLFEEGSHVELDQNADVQLVDLR